MVAVGGPARLSPNPVSAAMLVRSQTASLSPAGEFPADDAGGGKPQPVPVEAQGPVQVVDGEGQQRNVGMHPEA